MASIEDFKSLISLKGGLARSNRFRVLLPPRAGLTAEELNVLCKDAVLPGRQLLTRERTIGLTTRKIAYGFAQEDVALTFHVMNDYTAKKYFEEWQQSAVNLDTYELNYKTEYSQSVKIFQRDVQNRDIYGVELLEAFPTTLNAIQLNNELDGTVEVNVQLSYTNWRTIL